MSRAIVIKGANFETNRVALINLANDIPCTAVALDQETYTPISQTTPVAVTATLTPADTTDELVLSVADTTIAQIVNGGLIAVGFGTTTLTAMCGSASATAIISITEIEHVATLVDGKRIQQASTSSWPNEQPLQMSSSVSASDRAIVDNAPDDNKHNRINGVVAEDYSVFIMPTGTQRVEIATSTSRRWAIQVRYASTTNHITEENYSYLARYISSEQLLDNSNTGRAFCTLPEGADSFACESSYLDASDTVTIKFYGTAA